MNSLLAVTDAEREKYEDIWSYAEYSRASPGFYYLELFYRVMNPQIGQSVLDVGTGTGTACKKFKERGLVPRGFDITDAGWKFGSDIPLTLGCIWRDLPVGNPVFDFAYCCDVMEHIPTEFTALSVSEILRACNKAFFSISFRQEQYGNLVGKPLHLTVKPFTWWRDLLREVGTVYEARDLLENGVFVVGR